MMSYEQGRCAINASLEVVARHGVTSLDVVRSSAFCLMLLVERNHQDDESLTLDRPLRAPAAVASDGSMTPTIPLDRADEAILRYVRELAKRLAREDHQAEIATRQASNL
ncbi:MULTISPECIES: hypothetical protein [unclassified Bradyrhizobium]|uniref:hypothetical protein n=1 Tax=unclassified Bradyrhizobium TaxID=2631580 RepID=UPI001FF95943|nr:MULTISPECIES: hypothetical protein [unclassified Bradyrhizobium]MCK1349403.1 hypothetical protein [Bradyrhizobium sp. CW11]MCK1590347.1 hypothetical protein [Bradyrhizobium sp. 169]